jgi:hypothetical protein
MFVTAIPNWKPGDEFLAGSALRKFRVVDVSDEEPPPEANGVLTVDRVRE